MKRLFLALITASSLTFATIAPLTTAPWNKEGTLASKLPGKDKDKLNKLLASTQVVALLTSNEALAKSPDWKIMWDVTKELIAQMKRANDGRSLSSFLSGLSAAQRGAGIQNSVDYIKKSTIGNNSINHTDIISKNIRKLFEPFF